MPTIEDRQLILEKVLGELRSKEWTERNEMYVPMLTRLMTGYDRYTEAGQIVKYFIDSRVTDFSEFRVLDYGCGVSDYGIVFARIGCAVYIYDLGTMMRFTEKRYELESLTAMTYRKDLNLDLAIFGEVLEHLENPLEVLQDVHKQLCLGGYLFVSSYPFGKKELSNYQEKGHTLQAYEQREECEKFLNNNFVWTRFDGAKAIGRKQ